MADLAQRKKSRRSRLKPSNKFLGTDTDARNPAYTARVALPPSQTSLSIEPHALLPLPFTWFYSGLVWFMTLSLIAPLRLAASLCVLFLTSMIAALCKREFKGSHHVPTPRERLLQSLVLVGIRIQLFFMGVHFIRVERKGKTLSKLMVANHVSVMDSFILAWVEHTRSVIDADSMKQPFVGMVMQCLQFLDMSDHICKMGGDPEHGRDIIKEALQSKNQDPILVFPQGTTSRQDVITAFQAYPFSIPKEYITPVVIKFYNRTSPLTPWLHHNPWYHLYLLCCNIDNSVKITFAEPVRPLGCGKDFKEKIRGQMAMLLNASVTGHSYSDSRLLEQVIKSHIQVNSLENVLVNDWLRHFHLNISDIFTALHEFTQIDCDESGYIDYGEFCKYFRVDPAKLKTLQLFRSLDDSQSLSIEFDEFLTAFAMARKSSALMVPLLFKICDINGNGEIGEDDFKMVFCNEDDFNVREFAANFFTGSEKLCMTEWAEKVKQKSSEPAVEFAIQNIFRQNYLSTI